MSEQHDREPPANPPTGEEGAPGRRPYEPPRILSREPLEAVAALCTPVPPAKANLGQCPQGPVSS
jgi:hypothetical protein